MSEENTTQASTEDRLAAFFNPEPAETAEPESAETPAEDTPEETPEGLLADEPGDEPQVVDQPDADVLDLTYNGEPVKVSREEAKTLAQRGLHLQRAEEKVLGELHAAQSQAVQMREVADRVLRGSAEIDGLRGKLAGLQMMAQQFGLNPQAIYQLSLTDPAKAQEQQALFNMLNADYMQTQNTIAAKSREIEEHSKNQEGQHTQAEWMLLGKLVPSVKDPAKYEQVQKTMTDMARTLRPETVRAISSNAEVYAAFLAKAELDKIKSIRKDKVAVAQKAPQVAKPGAAQPSQTTADRYQKQRAALKKSGSVDDAARLLRMRMR